MKHFRLFLFFLCCSPFTEAQIKGVIGTSEDTTSQKPKNLTAKINTANRIALVIGNENYSTGKLKNPINDARAIADALRQNGFKVIYKTDIMEADIAGVINEFGEAILKNDGVNLFYYSGHGIQFNQENYFLPVNTNLEKADSVSAVGSKLKTIMHKMDQAPIGLNIIILDACRSNPFDNLKNEITQGLSDIDDCPINTTVLYATKPNKVAYDGETSHSPFTESLLKHINGDTLELYEIARRVTNDVVISTDQQQCPILLGTNLEVFYFKEKLIRKKPDLYIISIGISKYGNEHDLKYGAKSAHDFSALIKHTSAGDTSYNEKHYFVLSNEEATKFNILRLVNEVRQKAKEGDVILFYYNGYIEKGYSGEPYCVPAGGDFKNIDATGILCSTLFSVLTKMPCKSILFFDKVETADLDPSKDDSFDYIRQLNSPANNVVVVTTANGGDQYALESENFQSTIFIYSLKKAFEKSLADKRFVDILTFTNDIQQSSSHLTKGLQTLKVFLPRGWLNFTLFNQ